MNIGLNRVEKHNTTPYLNSHHNQFSNIRYCIIIYYYHLACNNKKKLCVCNFNEWNKKFPFFCGRNFIHKNFFSFFFLFYFFNLYPFIHQQHIAAAAVVGSSSSMTLFWPELMWIKYILERLVIIILRCYHGSVKNLRKYFGQFYTVFMVIHS